MFAYSQPSLSICVIPYRRDTRSMTAQLMQKSISNESPEQQGLNAVKSNVKALTIYICVDLPEHHQTHTIKTHEDKTHQFKKTDVEIADRLKENNF